jgi:hypothetical protein
MLLNYYLPNTKNSDDSTYFSGISSNKFLLKSTFDTPDSVAADHISSGIVTAFF